ncbi:hypothetical protein [Halobacillus seohaensis]|uniref:Type VII secretion protein EssB n=1 Tax=Halobacillus seohaensis TaxID=447421 RepID=A0ABW2EFJ5_9BACI
MKVLFTSKLEGEITSFHPYSFHEVVEKTAELDAKWKKKNTEPVALDFMVSNEEGDKLYNGTYIVGAGETTNIYDHICQKLIQIPMKDQQQETERDIILQKLTSHTPTSYQIDLTELSREDTDNSYWWKSYSKRGKIITVSLVSLGVVAIITSIALAMIMINQSQALKERSQELNEVKTIKHGYEMAMTGEKSEAIGKLQDKESLSKMEQEALIHFLVSNRNYEEAVNQLGKGRVSFLSSQVMQIHGIDELEKFQENYPSPSGAFELAYHKKDYEKALDVEDVPMTQERYKEKGWAYLKLNQTEEAKKMASEAKSDELNDEINQYEELKLRLTKLNNQIETEKKSDDKDQNKINSLEEKKESLEKEQNNF